MHKIPPNCGALKSDHNKIKIDEAMEGQEQAKVSPQEDPQALKPEVCEAYLKQTPNEVIKKDFEHEKAICFVFADVFSRMKDEDLLAEGLDTLRSGGILEERQCQKAMLKYLIKKPNMIHDDPEVSFDSNEDSPEEELMNDLGGQIYDGLTSKMFKIPEGERQYVLKDCEDDLMGLEQE